MKNLSKEYEPELINAGVGSDGVEKLVQAWSEPWRVYHDKNHLSNLLSRIKNMFEVNTLTLKEAETLIIAAWFHDAVYEPWAFDNEERSYKLFEEMVDPKRVDHKKIKKIIMATKEKTPPKENLANIFWKIDNAVLLQGTVEGLLTYEAQIRKEFQFFDYSLYREGRIDFLNTWLKLNRKRVTDKTAAAIQNLMVYVQTFRPKIGVYPGSFDPFHKGHLSILEKAEEIFDKVIIAVGINPEKDEDRKRIINVHNVVKYRQLDEFQGLLTKYLTLKETASDITLIRGLRNGDDLNYELDQLRVNEKLKKDLKTIFIACDSEYERISSSKIRLLKSLDDPDATALAEEYLP